MTHRNEESMRALLVCAFVVGCTTPTAPTPQFLLTTQDAAVGSVTCVNGVCTANATGSVGAISWRSCPTCTDPWHVGETIFTITLSPKTRTWLLIAGSDTGSITFTAPNGSGTTGAPPPPSTVRFLTGVGCSNTRRAFEGWPSVGGDPRPTVGFKDDSLSGGTPSRYLRLSAEKWPPHDRWMAGVRPASQNVAPWAGWTQPTGDAIWYQVCLGNGELPTDGLDRSAEVLDSLLRYRNETRIVVTGLGTLNGCTWADYPRTEWIADSVVARFAHPNIRRGPTIVLNPVDMEPDGCHPRPSTGGKKWWQAIQSWVRVNWP